MSIPSAGHQAMLAGGGAPTARDYIADSPILLFDGIENYGYGVHNANNIAFLNDPTKTNYKYSNFYTTDDSLFGNFYQANASKYMSISIPSDYTLEWVGTWNNSPCQLGQLFSGCLQFRYDNSVYFWYGSSSYYRQVNISKNIRQSVCVQREGNTVRIYTNGSLSFTGTGPTASSVNFGTQYFPGSSARVTFETCALRWHSRALTAAELAKNNAIDKARFGLP